MEGQCVDILDRIESLGRGHITAYKAEIRQLKQAYNRAMNKVYNRSRLPVDIIEVFPSEVWIQIIRESLPAHGYPSALLLLTTVSMRWMRALTSVPILWACVQIRLNDEDSLSTFATFRHLSGDAPLLLTIYAQFSDVRKNIAALLPSVSSRLRDVVIAWETPFGFNSTEDDQRIIICLVLSSLMYSPCAIPWLDTIRLDHQLNLPIYDFIAARRMTDERLPSTLRMIRGWCFHLEDLQASQHSFQCLEEMESCAPLDIIVCELRHKPRLKRLVGVRNEHHHIIRLQTPQYLPTLSGLTSLSYKGPYRYILLDVLISVSPSLLDLELSVPVSKVADLQAILERLSRVRTLSLEINDWNNSDEGNNDISAVAHLPSRSINILSLRRLTLLIHANERGFGSQRALRSLVSTFAILYKAVEEASFHLPEGNFLLSSIFRYISELSMLRKLHVAGSLYHFLLWDPQDIVLPWLEELDTNTDLVRRLDSHCLNSLRITWGVYCEEREVLERVNALKLCITHPGSGGGDITLPQDSFPSLLDLTVSFLGAGVLVFLSFPYLHVVSISTEPDGLQATSLCFALLYQPDSCPSLGELRLLGGAPEWDILFLMLERRNFRRNRSIARICRVTLPYIPPHLIAPLAALLRGVFTARPSNEELSFEVARELVFNKTLPGCNMCLRNMLHSCDAPVLESHPSKFTLDPKRSLVYPATAPPSHSDMNAEVLEWLRHRESLVSRWNSDIWEWDTAHRRARFCERVLRGATIEITEYDKPLDAY